jgi:hypothetical protein
MDLEVCKTQIFTLGVRPATKMGLARQFLQFFHPKSTRIDENLYDDPLWIIHAYLGRILVPKIFTK